MNLQPRAVSRTQPSFLRRPTLHQRERRTRPIPSPVSVMANNSTVVKRPKGGNQS